MARGHKPKQTTFTKKQLSRRRREQQQLLWIWVSVISLSAIVLLLLAVGLISQRTKAVAMVNGETIQIGEYQKRVRFWYYYYNAYLMPGSFDNLEPEQRTQFFQQIVDQMIEEALVRQEATKAGVSVSQDELQIELEEQWFQHYRTPPTPMPSPTPNSDATADEGTPVPTSTPDTEEAFQANYQEFANTVLKPARVTESEFRQIVEVTLLREKLKLVLVPEVPTEQEQVNLRYITTRDDADARLKIASYQAGVAKQVHAQHILVETREEAEDVLQRLKAGEDFAALAAELSIDDSNKDQGGDLGWFGRGRMVPEFEEAAFGGELGLYPTPVETAFGFHVINILEREDRPIDLAEELFDGGWQSRTQLADRFGDLAAEMIFGSEVGLIPNPVPTDSGVIVVEVLAREVRPLDEDAQEQLRSRTFEARLAEIREKADIQDLWEPDMVPRELQA